MLTKDNFSERFSTASPTQYELVAGVLTTIMLSLLVGCNQGPPSQASAESRGASSVSSQSAPPDQLKQVQQKISIWRQKASSLEDVMVKLERERQSVLQKLGVADRASLQNEKSEVEKRILIKEL